MVLEDPQRAKLRATEFGHDIHEIIYNDERNRSWITIDESRNRIENLKTRILDKIVPPFRDLLHDTSLLFSMEDYTWRVATSSLMTTKDTKFRYRCVRVKQLFSSIVTSIRCRFEWYKPVKNEGWANCPIRTRFAVSGKFLFSSTSTAASNPNHQTEAQLQSLLLRPLLLKTHLPSSTLSPSSQL